MIEPRGIQRYVQGFIQGVHEQNRIHEVEQALKDLDKLLRENRQIKAVLHHPTISRDRKKKLLRELLGEGVPDILFAFIDYVIEKKRERILEFLYLEYKRAADRLQGIVRARVRSAVELTEEQAKKLKATLEKSLGKSVELECEVDKTLIGGLQVMIDSEIIDGSVTGRLNRLHRHLLAQKR